MNNNKRFIINIACILAISIIGATLVMGLDLGGTRWLKFVLYLIFFAALSSSALFSSIYSCSLSSRLRKRS
jgi:hypothetical protein